MRRESDSDMHSAVGSPATAQAQGQSSLGCCLSLDEQYALKVAEPKQFSLCLFTASYW